MSCDDNCSDKEPMPTSPEITLHKYRLLLLYINLQNHTVCFLCILSFDGKLRLLDDNCL